MSLPIPVSFQSELNLFDFDLFWEKRWVIGVDEVGRGALAGPIQATAVLIDTSNIKEKIARLPEESIKVFQTLNDSKKVTPTRRQKLVEPIEEVVLAYKSVLYDANEIDSLGIEETNQLALTNSVKALAESKDIDQENLVVLIDGNGIRGERLGDIKSEAILKGDGRSAAIAMASILAKTQRDTLMVSFDEQFSEYGFAKNKGYGSADHIAAIKEYGASDIHRNSFCGNFIEK